MRLPVFGLSAEWNATIIDHCLSSSSPSGALSDSLRHDALGRFLIQRPSLGAGTQTQWRLSLTRSLRRAQRARPQLQVEHAPHAVEGEIQTCSDICRGGRGIEPFERICDEGERSLDRVLHANTHCLNLAHERSPFPWRLDKGKQLMDI